MSTSYELSDLTNPRYGYDFVVATTQSSINAILLQYLASVTEPTVTACYVWDSEKEMAVPIDYDTLKQEARGTDPFSVPNASDPNKDQDLINLKGVQFVGAFRATMGLPAGVAPEDLPDLVTLGADTSEVIFNLLCSAFNVVGFGGDGMYNVTWINQSQSPTESLWTFASKVDLRLSTLDQSQYSSLPPNIQQALKNVSGTAFSVQQLLFDLDNAGLWSTPTIPNIDPNSDLGILLQKTFIGQYFAQMQSSGQPLLGVGVVQQTPPTASLDLTNLNFEVSPYVDQNGQPYSNPTPEQQQMATLNYLCATNNNNLPPSVQFSWNWVDISDQSNFDGVISINRNTFVQYLTAPLVSFATQYCLKPTVEIDESDMKYYFNCWFTYQTPTVTTSPTGNNVMNLSYYATDTASRGPSSAAKLTITVTYTMNMDFSGDNTVTVTQHEVIYVYIRNWPFSAGGNMADTTLTDTYSLFVDGQGNLGCSHNSTSSSNVTFPSVKENDYSGIGAIAGYIESKMSGFGGGQLQSVPFGALQNFVFPGGNTFAFKDVQFSDNLDLVCPITYQDPSGPAVMPRSKPKPSKGAVDLEHKTIYTKN